MGTNTNFYGLLVGINTYQSTSITDLRGCVADVQAMHSFLINRLDVPEANLRVLTSSGEEEETAIASRTNMLAAWTEQVNKLKPGDQFLFQYSGHGAQAVSIDPDEPDGYDETIIPWDSRTKDATGDPVYDILDKEMAALVDQAEATGAYVTIVLDCCHSGSGTRSAEEPDQRRPLVRRTVKDERKRPPHTLVPGTLEGMAARAGTYRSSSGWAIGTEAEYSGASAGSDGPAGGGHVLLAGCRDEELSHEYASPETGQWHGATTYFLLQALQGYHPKMTWQDAHNLVQTRVNALYSRQLPQLEGPPNRQIFDGLAPLPTPHLLVIEKEPTSDGVAVKINGGAPLGLTEGSEVAVYSSEGSMDGKPLARGKIVETKADHAWAILSPPVEPDDIKIPSRVLMTAYGYDRQVYPVATEDALLRTALAVDDQGNTEASPFLQVVDMDDPVAALRVRVTGEEFTIHDASGAQIVTQAQPHTAEGAESIVQNLVHLAIYNNVRNLRNPQALPALEDALEVTALSYTSAGFAGPKDGIPLDSINSALLPGRKVWLTVKNTGQDPLYLSVFNLSANYGIFQIWPERSSYTKVDPGKDFFIDGLKPKVNNPFADKSKEILKVFATRDPQAFDALTLPELNKPIRETDTRSDGPLANLLAGVGKSGTRQLVRERNDTHERWITKQIEITVINESESKPLSTGQTQVAIGSTLAISMEKPSDFEGTLIISSMERITRSVAEPSIHLPPGLSTPDAQEIFQPLSLEEGTRDLGGTPTVIGIQADPDQLASVSDEAPLRLELTIPDEPELLGIVPIVFDGEDYVLAGEEDEPTTRSMAGEGSRRVAVKLTRLLPPVDQDNTAGDTRELKRTARLFFYKIYKGRLPDDTGLRRVDYATGETPVYAPAQTGDLDGVKRVALLVHGFNSDTRWYLNDALPRIHPYGQYDRYFTFDYETFGTQIEQNGTILTQALGVIGFGPEDDVTLDVFCHSMGTQVVRVMVELKGGDAFVDRVFMAGPPNAGTRLAEGKALLKWAATMGVNAIEVAAPSVIASWLVKKTFESAMAIEDLRPGSQLYKDLNDATTPIDVPYYVVIGNNQVADDHFRWQRLFSKSGLEKAKDAALDVLMGGPHDVVISVASAKNVRHGNWPQLTVEEITGTHFVYFKEEESVEIFAKWMAKIEPET